MLKTLKKIPWWGWVAGIGFFILQYATYRAGDFLSDIIGTKAAAWCPKITAIDDLIPVVAIFAVIYLFSYVFWICAPIVASLTKRSNFYNYLIGLSIAYFIGFLIFTFAPTYMDRAAEGLLNYSSDSGLFDSLLAIIYSADGDSRAFNLFPSFHCLISAYCYLGIRKQPEISKGFKIYTLIMAMLICCSTLLTKQHYFIDTVGGIGIAILVYIIVLKWNPGKKLLNRKNHAA